ncbi:Ribokinase-like protein [Rhodotorula toruloides]
MRRRERRESGCRSRQGAQTSFPCFRPRLPSHICRLERKWTLLDSWVTTADGCETRWEDMASVLRCLARTKRYGLASQRRVPSGFPMVYRTDLRLVQLPTGRAVIQLSSSTADNSIVLLPGANFSQISPLHDLTSAQLSTYSHILLQNEIPLQETKGALRRAKSAGLTTLFNPSPMPSRQALTEFEWQHLDWLVINEGEGADLLAALADPAATESSGGAAALLGALRRTALGSLTGIIMTRGADGVVSSLRDGSVVEVGPGKVVGGVKDTTGAGDCFTVSLAFHCARFMASLMPDFDRATSRPSSPPFLARQTSPSHPPSSAMSSPLPVKQRQSASSRLARWRACQRLLR